MALNNPAMRLHKRLKDWQVTPNGESTLGARAIAGRTWEETHIETLEWVAQVRDFMESNAALEGDEDVADIDAFISKLMKAVFVLDHAMGTAAGQRAHIDDGTLNHLRSIGRLWKTVSPSAEAVNDLLEAAHEVQQLVMESTHLDDEARRYLHQLAAHLIKAVGEFEVAGPEAVRSLANELVGAIAVHLAAEDAEAAKGLVNRLANASRSGFFTYAVPAISGAMASKVFELLP